MFLPAFLLGYISAVILLATVPKLYKKLRCQRCSRSDETILEEQAISGFVELQCRDTRTDDYTEVDEKKTRTSATPNQAATRTKKEVDANADMGYGQRYEKCTVGNGKSDRYSDIETKESSTVTRKTQNVTTPNCYDAFSPGRLSKEQEKRLSNPENFILEPGSDKGLPIKQLESKLDTLPSDKGHVYFKLEPGTSKETPAFQNTMTDTSNSNVRESKPIYFDLEPMAVTCTKKEDANADMGDCQRYEECIVDNGKSHIYSDIETKESSTSKTQNVTTTNSYDAFSPGKLSKEQEKRLSNPEYFILVPGSDKRLPVKQLESKLDTFPFDPGHVYFKLEPGTSKVTPVFQKTMTYACNSSGRESGPIYFVLEPMAEKI